MKKRIAEVMQIVEDVLGCDCNGVYINSSSIYESQDQDIITLFPDDGEEGNVCHLDYCFNSYDIALGASKLVIIPKNKNYVIKVPFTHMYNEVCVRCDGDENAYCEGEGYCSGKCEYESCASCCHHCMRYRYEIATEVQYDICAAEDNIYEEASDELQQLLVPNIFIGMYNDVVPVYIQKKIKHTARGMKDTIPFKADEKIVAYLAKKYHSEIDDIGLVQYLSVMGISKFRNLLMDIGMLDDLHAGNWGFFEDGSIGIIDYGGYSEEGLWG